MKKIAAILLLSVYLFNLFGYQCVITLLQQNASQKLESRIDNLEYDEANLLEIRVPLNMPYQERFTEFERHYGEITVEGKAYTYVKRKIEGDILVLKCIANENKQQLSEKADAITKANTGHEQNNQSGKKQTGNSFKQISIDCIASNNNEIIAFINSSSTIKRHNYNSSLVAAEIVIPHQPPKRA